MKKTPISIGIPAYNEEQNITKLLDALLKQKLSSVLIREIIVVSDGSTDKTCELVMDFIKKHKTKNIKLIHYKQRKGKWFAINVFLRNAKSKYLILESADNIPNEKAVEFLISKLRDSKVGIVASKIVPINREGFWAKIGFLLYELHHLVSLESPKFGELIAFKKVFDKIPKTIVDEEEIARIIKEKGFLGFYEPRAIVYIKTPSNFKDFISQRRRIFCGHYFLAKKKDYKASTFDNKRVLRILFGKKIKKDFFLFSLLFLELLSRILGFYDYLFDKEKHVKWEIIKSIKKL